MQFKIFAERGQYKLTGDVRDLGVKFEQRSAVRNWCIFNGIEAMIVGTGLGYDLWRVKDEQSRILFVLRWGV